jgi:DNA-binding transcriptional ArsR family regulator
MSRPYANADAYRAIADRHRRRTLELLHDRARSPSELAAEMRLSPQTLSHHLGILRTAGLVASNRAGRRRVYRADIRRLRMVADWCSQLLKPERGQFNRPA